jgi:NAD(P)-dependent dehydrogenase (short-subunit alcohol dehydrogenase family)
MTPMVEKVFADNPAQQEYVYGRTPSLVKMGSLEEMALAIWFLCSPVTTYTTGQTLILDGGWSVQ